LIDLQSGGSNNMGCNFFKWWCYEKDVIIM